MHRSIILASQSPRRQQLLQWAEIPFEVIVSNTDESFPGGLSFEDAAIHIARHKAITVSSQVNDGKIILAADTIVVWKDSILGKPVDRNEAIDFLQKLSGDVHKVITGVCIIQHENETCFADTTEVAFHPLTDEQIEFYVDKYKPYDKAGAYAIQEWIGVTGIKSIKGDFYNVMGLPISRVVQALNL
jgi:septum formation protein